MTWTAEQGNAEDTEKEKSESVVSVGSSRPEDVEVVAERAGGTEEEVEVVGEHVRGAGRFFFEV